MGKSRVVYYSDESFEDRKEAGRLLATALEVFAERYGGFGHPRGGMVVAGEIAGALNSELDIALSRKLGAPAIRSLPLVPSAKTASSFLTKTWPFARARIRLTLKRKSASWPKLRIASSSSGSLKRKLS